MTNDRVEKGIRIAASPEQALRAAADRGPERAEGRTSPTRGGDPAVLEALSALADPTRLTPLDRISS
ncbi:MAG: hypothetical protein ACRDV6_04780 [Acidimicrobiales bacterium]